jgi:hypothetical protein
MNKTVSLATKLERSRCRGKLLAALESEEIITSIIFGENGQFLLHTTNWDDYWKDIQESSRDASELIDNLHASWSRYIRSGFDSRFRREYCYRYSLLLDVLFVECKSNTHSELKRSNLNQALAFECFGIKGPEPPSSILAGGTSTLRNPNYLLSKLIRPKAVDDPQYLPLITVPGKGSSALFYYYRQHKLSVDTELSVLLFLSTSTRERPQSFHILNMLESLLGEGIDPRADERAARIAKGIIQPYLKNILSSRVRNGALDFELVDIGSGSGLLAAQVSQHVVRFLKDKDINPTVRVYMIDLSMAVASRFFKGKELGKATDCITSIGADYRKWFSTKPKFSQGNKLRVGLVSRFFNNMSLFNIEPFPAWQIISGLGGEQGSAWKECLPSRCLGPNGKGSEKLVINNTIISAGDGRSFVQPSLSNYFQALDKCSQSRQKEKQDEQPDAVYLPIRAFDPDCLMTDSNESIIDKLLDECELLILQDPDLHPDLLKEHRKLITKHESSAIDVTKSLGLRRHFSYALLPSQSASLKALQGERLW